MPSLPHISRREVLTRIAAAACSGLAASLHADEPAPAPGIVERLAVDAQNSPLALQFRGTTRDECRQWQQKFSTQLRSLLGPFQPPERWQTTVVSTTAADDHRREELLLHADGHPPLPVYLLIPNAKAGRRRAGIVALHGHGAYGHHPIAGRDDMPGVAAAIQSANYDYGLRLVKRGYVVACPCFTPFGDRLGNPEAFGKTDPCADTFIRMQILGKLLMAENLRDALWGLELLARRDDVDADRLGCVGLSYGGRMTMLTAAVEPRIKIAVISGALNVMQERISRPYSCGAQIIPGLLQYGDTPEIASLIAPRHAVWEAGNRDGLIRAPWADDALARIGRAYTALGAADHLTVDRFDGGHVWHGEVAYPLLERVLG
jgi:dienelactone hydrolase